MSDTTVDGLPPGIEIPDSLTAATDASGQALDTGTVQMIPFPFCLAYQGSSWRQSITVSAPSPDLAALTIGQFVQLLNAQAVRAAYPANFAWNSGDCT